MPCSQAGNAAGSASWGRPRHAATNEAGVSAVILGAGGGTFSTATIMETAPVHLTDEELTPEGVAARFPQISDWKTARAYAEVLEQVQVFLAPAA